MAHDNDWVNEPRYGPDATQAMRDANSLEYGALITYGSIGAGDGQFSQPSDVFVYGDEIYAADAGNQGRVTVLDLDGVYQRKWDGGVGASAIGITVAVDEVYVARSSSDDIDVYNLAGTLQRTIGGPGAGNGQFSDPWGMRVLSGELYVCDRLNGRIQVFNVAGVYQRQWATSSNPQYMDIAGGEVYVTEAGDEVEVFDTVGNLQRTWGSTGAGNGELNDPHGIAVDGSEVWVFDQGNARIQIFNLAGAFQSQRPGQIVVGTDTNDYRCIKNHISISARRPINGVDWAIYFAATGGSGSGETWELGAYYRAWFKGPSGAVRYNGQFYSAHSAGPYIGVEVLQTEFNKYPSVGASVSLGTPDGGAAVPTLNALDSGASLVGGQHIVDLREAIEGLVSLYENGGTSNPFNWNPSNADNLYFVALGDRDGMSAGFFDAARPAYDWERTLARMLASDLIAGTDGNDYTVIKNHISEEDRKPITGVDWETYFEAEGGSGSGAVWADDEYYTTRQTSALDIGEVKLCIEKLQESDRT